VAGLAAVLPGSPVFNPEGYGGWGRDSVRAVDIVQGSFFLTTRTLWERLGGFDPVFFMYGEEADFCERARRLGFRPTVTPEAEIVHHGGASERQRGEKLVHVLRAKRTLIERYWSPPWRAVGRVLLWLWVSSRCLAFRTATLLGVRSVSPAAEAWSVAWRRRREWGRILAAERGGSP
jgi:GT2 family glycosyltransferase